MSSREYTRTCSACGKHNRVPLTHLARNGRCGECKAALEPHAEPIDVGPEELKTIVKSAQVPVLIDFWAEWCGPCRMAAPAVKRVASDMAGRALVLKVDIQAHPELAQVFGVSGIPTFAVMRDGDIVSKQSGLVGHKQMQNWLASAAA